MTPTNELLEALKEFLADAYVKDGVDTVCDWCGYRELEHNSVCRVGKAETAIHKAIALASHAPSDPKEPHETSRSKRTSQDEQEVSPRVEGAPGNLPSESAAPNTDALRAISGAAGTTTMCSADIGKVTTLTDSEAAAQPTAEVIIPDATDYFPKDEIDNDH